MVVIDAAGGGADGAGAGAASEAGGKAPAAGKDAVPAAKASAASADGQASAAASATKDSPADAQQPSPQLAQAASAKAPTLSAVAPSTAHSAAQPASASPASAGAATPATASAAAQPASAAAGAVYAGPAVRKLARELGVDLNSVSGSGPRNRILKEDVQAFVRNAVSGAAPASGAGIPPIPPVDFAEFGEVDAQPLSRIDKLTAANMHRNWLNVPHVTQLEEADVSKLETFRADMKKEGERRGVKLTPLPFLLKAAAAALRANPRLNAALHPDGEHLVYRRYAHIGMAVDTPAGLVVPVIRDADRKNLWELAAETAELAAKARDRKLSPAEMRGACFTISSLGRIGGTGFTPIVNAPEVAILGVSRMEVKPRWNGKEFVPKQILPLSLSYDHRVVNGALAGRFLTDLAASLEDIRRLLL